MTKGHPIRRGVVDYNGMGDTAGGIVVVRYGESVYDVLQRVKATIRATVQPSLPEGVELVITYDRSQLIEHSVETLTEKLIEEMIIVSVVCVVFLFHEHEEAKPEGERRSRTEVVIEAAKEVGPSLFFSLLIITVSFLPVFALQDQEGRLFKPLAFTKTFSMMFAAILSITVGPLLMRLLIRGRIPSEQKNPVNRFLIWVYHPFAHFAFKNRYLMVVLALVAVVSVVPIFMSLGSEFMPPLWEGTIMYMPVAPPGGSIETKKEAIVRQDRIIKSFPEVESVFAKAGRAETATDPAPLVMVETIINLKPQDQWRSGMTHDKLIDEMDAALRKQQIGFTNSWTMPIKGRIDMLATGIRTPIGVKIFGPELKKSPASVRTSKRHSAPAWSAEREASLPNGSPRAITSILKSVARPSRATVSRSPTYTK